MSQKIILPLGAALAALGANGGVAATTTDNPAQVAPASKAAADASPNVLYASGEDLLGLIVTKSAEGTVLAYHYSHVSHSSHSSHSSHRSHYSSRY